MNPTSFADLLRSTGLPVAYSHFAEPRQPPMMVWTSDSREDFYADGRIYKRIYNARIELYNKIRDFGTERDIEATLESAAVSFAFEFSEWLEGENCYMTAWECQFIETEE